ncbi:stage III sporulation protein AG [Tumebacillus algifaecis]|uniref:Stage III sporulation protein AG n=1 Tax=Tumebacillus algifaecis TaxID=1214604 RepID=A0A223D2R4_9BACL|nr:stage III sporulation protein AG [Tumebacillus algifaecis]ASS75948.1 stage III sporulation protein AG [Tumebacillus algifaecis]
MEKDNVQTRMQNLMKNKKLLIALGALGVVLLLNPLTWFQSAPNNATIKGEQSVKAGQVINNTDRGDLGQYEQVYENRLTEILNMVMGVSDASVMVTIDSSEEVIYAENSQENRQTNNESDTKGGTRGVTQLDKSGQLVMTKESGQEQPVVVKTIKPRVRGVVVVARGAEQIKTEALIKEAVQRALEVPPHRISVLPKK